MSCGVGCRRVLDPALLWLWCRPVATAPLRPLAWEPPYAVGSAQEIAKRKRKEKNNNNKKRGYGIFTGIWEKNGIIKYSLPIHAPDIFFDIISKYFQIFYYSKVFLHSFFRICTYLSCTYFDTFIPKYFMSFEDIVD